VRERGTTVIVKKIMLKDKTTRSNVRPTGQRPALGSQYRDIGIKAVVAAAQPDE